VSEAASPTLATAPRGGSVRVVSIDGPASVAQRLLEMGLTPGAVVGVVREAPLGDPLEVRVKGYRLSVRRDDARLVRVVPA
jgi:Fe2+ transport system protein FeoA